MAEPNEHTVRDLDPRSLRGLAHPLRVRLMVALREGPATASQLADRLGESSGATSYHLRQLAAYGFVEDAPEHGKGRERWWKAAHQGIRIGDSIKLDASPETRGAVSTLMHENASLHAQELSTWLGTMHDWPEEWIVASDVSDYKLRLTPERTRELNDKIHALIESYQDEPPGAPNTAQVRLHLHTLPRTLEDTE
ncbi:ArsR/SmtB family transcription factor [Streptomyces luteolus]|uniref:Winged helix-turn-helix domain-containing protein n=1 Tax=Streptomyces luteolus TaxID=3043615 RepID=A0ABT6T1K7_9ACTN|nr:winged helix-turn-helix domain-containing protein [Streptomyces sp. B-S-A12]MDI3421268.1 winged helix-turn-helix domain-containing protein [Streptomyces sp. B-S-A12]